MKRFWLGLVLLLFVVALSSCAGTRTLMMTADNSPPKNRIAEPELRYSSLEDWKADRANIRDQLFTHVYGFPPKPKEEQQGEPSFTEIEITQDELELYGDIDAFRFEIGLQSYGIDRSEDVVVLLPKDRSGPVPIIIMQNFCPNNNVLPLTKVPPPRQPTIDCSGESALSGVFGYFFGRYIVTPPIKEIMDRGYAIAVMHPPVLVPDNAEAAAPILSELNTADRSNPAGAILSWALAFEKAADVLDNDERFSSIITYGHSRYGKSALLATALSDKIDGVISHQSGTGGASLSRDKPGETIAQITEGYPHWFTPRYASYAEDQSGLPIDQHGLLALLAPKPVLLGNARRDIWSDPDGAFRAAQGANQVYQLYDSEGISASNLGDFKPSDDIAYWIRSGTHGVTEEDWPAFLEFLDAHFR